MSFQTSDLRNRVVGARLQKDGKMPYFYKWQPGDGVRYYDPINFDNYKVSKITASPFFHTLIYPLVELDYQKIIYVWTIIQYVLLCLMTWLIIAMAGSAAKKWAISILCVTLIYTAAWKASIYAMQLYLLIPFLVTLIFWCFNRKKYPLFFMALGGVLSAVLLLIRPNMILFFLPFLFLIDRYSYREILMFSGAAIVMIIACVLPSRQQELWKEYFQSLAEQVRVHQSMGTLQTNPPDPGFKVWEGWDAEKNYRLQRESDVINYSESGNVYILFEKLFHRKIPLGYLTAASLLSILVVFLAYFWKSKQRDGLPNVFMLGFSIYMIADHFSPISRNQYYTVQWFFLLSLAMLIYDHRYRYIYLLLLVGLILNLINSPYIKIEHTLGEYCWLLGFTLLSLFYKTPGPDHFKEKA